MSGSSLYPSCSAKCDGLSASSCRLEFEVEPARNDAGSSYQHQVSSSHFAKRSHNSINFLGLLWTTTILVLFPYAGAWQANSFHGYGHSQRSHGRIRFEQRAHATTDGIETRKSTKTSTMKPKINRSLLFSTPDTFNSKMPPSESYKDCFRRAMQVGLSKYRQLTTSKSASSIRRIQILRMATFLTKRQPDINRRNDSTEDKPELQSDSEFSLPLSTSIQNIDDEAASKAETVPDTDETASTIMLTNTSDPENYINVDVPSNDTGLEAPSIPTNVNDNGTNLTSTDSVIKDSTENSQREREERRQHAAFLSHSFQTREFVPAWYATNPHVQTVLGALARDDVKYSSGNNFPWSIIANGDKNADAKGSFQWDERQRMETPDGDFFDVDWKSSTSGKWADPDEAPIVLICHGLQSSSNSSLVKDMAVAFNNIGMDAACINFRGCSGELNRKPFGYHLSFTDDLKQMVQRLSSMYPKKPIYLSGFSLGANVVTKFLAELGDDATEKYNIYGAAVNAVPFNLTKVYVNVKDPGLTKTLYGETLFQSMMERCIESFDKCELPYSKEELLNCKTIHDMENLVISSIFGFEDAFDYYNQSSTVSILNQVAVPQLIVQALDDPFFVGNSNPESNSSMPLRIHYTEYGGHCGFILHNNEDNQGGKMTESYPTSWMPTELARFIEHIDTDRVARHGTRKIENEFAREGGKNLTNEILIDPAANTSDVAKMTSSDIFDTESNYNMSTSSASLISATAMTIQQRRKWAVKVSRSFKTTEFNPAWYATNPHVQTIFGVLAREQTMYASTLPNLGSLFDGSFVGHIESFNWDERKRMETPDGDFFDVDWKYCDSTDHVGRPNIQVPLVLICHGLQSSSSSPLAKEMAIAFNKVGMDSACINFRGCSGEINRTPYGYHLSFTEDLKLMVQNISSRYPNKPIYLSGFSLGANIVTKFLADHGHSAAEEYNVFGAAVNAVPFDMNKTHVNLNNPGVTRSLYGDRLLKSMVDRIEESYDVIDFPFPREKTNEWQTIMDVENDVICPPFGFKDAYDYYNKSKTAHILHEISVPQLVVQALDDPFFQGNTNPPDDPNLPIRIHYTEHGGHCGYVFHSPSGDGEASTSWMPAELARFLAHVHEETFSSGAFAKSNNEYRDGAFSLNRKMAPTNDIVVPPN